MSGQGQVGELLGKTINNVGKTIKLGKNNQQCELLVVSYDQCAMSELRNFRSINIMDEGNSQPGLQWIEAGREFEDILQLGQRPDRNKEAVISRR